MKYNVLVIDDEIDICETIADVISPLAKEVFVVQSAKAAMEVLDTKEVHMVISDINMPEMNGIELLKLLRQKRFGYPVVFVSASDSDEAIAKALEYGATDFIPKPFDSDELFALVKRTLATVDALAS